MRKNSFFRFFLGFLFLTTIGTMNGYSQFNEYRVSMYFEVKVSCEIPIYIDTNDLTDADKEKMAEMDEENYYCDEKVYEDGWHPYNRMLFDFDKDTVIRILQEKFVDTVYEHDGFIIVVEYNKITNNYCEEMYNLDSLIYEQRVYGKNYDTLHTVFRIDYVRTIDGYIVPEKMMQIWWNALPSGILYEGKYVSSYLYYELLDDGGSSLTKTGDKNFFDECMKQKVEIKETQQPTNVNIFPNPACSHFTVTNTENASLQLYNMLGQEVFSTYSKEGNTIINVNILPQGLYVLKVVKNGVVSTHKVVVRD